MKKTEKNLASKTEVHNVLDLEKKYIKKTSKFWFKYFKFFANSSKIKKRKSKGLSE